jgi:hypothetical protein
MRRWGFESQGVFHFAEANDLAWSWQVALRAGGARGVAEAGCVVMGGLVRGFRMGRAVGYRFLLRQSYGGQSGRPTAVRPCF